MINRLTPYRSEVNSTYLREDKTKISAYDSPQSGMRYSVRYTKCNPVNNYHQSQGYTRKRPSTSNSSCDKRRKEYNSSAGHRDRSITSHQSERKNAHNLEDTTSFDDFKKFTSSFLKPAEQADIYQLFLAYDIKEIINRYEHDLGDNNVLKVLTSNISQAGNHNVPVVAECLINYALYLRIPINERHLNACITAYANAAYLDTELKWVQKVEDVLKLFDRLLIKQDETTLSTTITAYANAARHDRQFKWVQKVKDVLKLFNKLALRPDEATLNTTITAFANAARHDRLFKWVLEVQTVLESFSKLNLQPNQITINATTAAFTNAAGYDPSFWWATCVEILLEELFELNLQPNLHTLNTVIKAFANAAYFDTKFEWVNKVEKLLELFSKLCLKHNKITVNTTIMAYANAARHDRTFTWVAKAKNMLNVLKKLELEPDEITLNTMIMAFANAAFYDSSLKWAQEVENVLKLFPKLGLKITETTLLAELTAYANAAYHTSDPKWVKKIDDVVASLSKLGLGQKNVTLFGQISGYINMAVSCTFDEKKKEYNEKAFSLLDNLVRNRVLLRGLGKQPSNSKPNCLTIDFHSSALTGKEGILDICEIIPPSVAFAIFAKHLEEAVKRRTINRLELITGYNLGTHYRDAFMNYLFGNKHVIDVKIHEQNEGLINVLLDTEYKNE